MSVINKMLQELDRRHALPAGASVTATGSRSGRSKRRQWFLRSVALVAAIAVGWVVWLAYQNWPRPIATPAAESSEEERPRAETPEPPRSVPEQASAAAPSKEAPAPVVAEPAQASVEPLPARAPAVAEPRPRESINQLRLASEIETPIIARPAMQPKRPAAGAPKATALLENEPGKVERRERATTSAERAENEFRHGAAMLKLGRAADAQAHFEKALDIDAAHRGARQALVAMYLERGQLESAQLLLHETLAANPAQPDFAVAQARILVEKKDLPRALKVLDAAAAAASIPPDYYVMRATVLQRLGRHGDAADSYKAALTEQPAQPQAWVGLGISLQAMNRRPEAAEAFKRALMAGPITAEMKTFAEQRLAALN